MTGDGMAKRSNGRRGHGERGNTIVELMFAIPSLLLLIFALFWLSMLGLSHARATDLAHQAARALARGADTTVVDQLIDRTMPGAAVTSTASSDVVEAIVTQDVSPPVPLLSGMSITVRASATAIREPGLP
jgi:Flp pilus assembly protein TadG